MSLKHIFLATFAFSSAAAIADQKPQVDIGLRYLHYHQSQNTDIFESLTPQGELAIHGVAKKNPCTLRLLSSLESLKTRADLRDQIAEIAERNHARRAKLMVEVHVAANERQTESLTLTLIDQTGKVVTQPFIESLKSEQGSACSVRPKVLKDYLARADQGLGKKDLTHLLAGAPKTGEHAQSASQELDPRISTASGQTKREAQLTAPSDTDDTSASARSAE